METGISSRNKGKVKFNKKNPDGAKKLVNKQNTKYLCIERKGNGRLKHYKSQQRKDHNRGNHIRGKH